LGSRHCGFILKKLNFHPLDYASAAAFLAYSASATVTPIVLVTLIRELNFTLTGGGGLEVIRSGLIFCTLLCSGFLAAHFGKARALGGSLLLLGMGLLLYSRAPGYAGLALALALAGVGGGVVEALLNPLVEELHREDSGRYLNIVNGFWSIGVLMTMVLGGEVITRTGSWRPVLVVLSAFCLCVGGLFLLLRKIGPAREKILMKDVLRHKRDILKSRGFWVFSMMMFFGGAVEGAYTFWIASYMQLVHGSTARVGGAGMAFFALGMASGRFCFGFCVPQKHLRRLIGFSALSGIGCSLIFPLLSPGWGLWLLFFLGGCSTACFWPSIQSLAVERLELEATALLILLSCGGIVGFSFASWALGLMGETFGLARAFGLIPLMLCGLLIFLTCSSHVRGDLN
jgi:fucose permease